MNLSLYDCVLVFADSLGVTWGKRVPGGEVLDSAEVGALVKRQ